MMKLLQKNKIIVFIMVVIFLLIVSGVLRILTPPHTVITQSPTYTQTNRYGTQTTFQNISYTGPSISVPTQLTVSKESATTTTETSFLAQIESDFQLTPLAQPPNVWTSPHYSLSKTDFNNNYDLVSNTVATPGAAVTKKINKDEALNFTQIFLKKYFPANQLKLLTDTITYYKADYDNSVTTVDKADWVLLSYTYQIDGYPIFYQNQREYPFSFIIDADNNIQKFSFFPFFAQFTPISKQDTISVAQAIKNINAGQGSLVSFQSNDSTATDISQIKSANLAYVTIEYRVDPKTSITYPFFSFSGDAVDAQGRSVSVSIITPAIQTVPQSSN